MKRFILAFAFLLSPAFCFAGPFDAAPVYRIDSSGNQHSQTTASAASIASAYNVSGDNNTTYILVGGTYSFDALLTGTGRIIGNSPADVILDFDGVDLEDLDEFLPRCWGMTVRADDGERVIGFPVGSNGELVSDLQLRTGTAAEIAEIVLKSGEPAWTTDTYQLFVGDGSTSGGKSAGSSQAAAVLILKNGTGSRPFYPSADTDAARGAAVEAARDASVSGDRIEVHTQALVASNLYKAGVRYFVYSPLLYSDSGPVFSFATDNDPQISLYNFGTIRSTVGDGIVVSSSNISLNLFSFGRVESTAAGKHGINISGGTVLIQGGIYTPGSGGVGINNTSGLVLRYPGVSGTESGTIIKQLFNATVGSAFLSLIDDATAADIRNTAGASGGIFPIAPGGTGLSSYTQGDLLYYNSGTTLSKLAKSTSATRYLANTGTNNNPAWAQVDLTNGVTGVLPSANGGAGTVSGIVKANGSGTTSAAVAGTDYVIPPVLPNLRGTVSSLNNSAADSAIAANTIYWQPIPFNRSGTQAAIVFRSATGAVGNCKAFIYSVNTDGSIGSVVATSDEQSTNVSNSLITLTASGAFQARYYAVGIVFSATPTVGVCGGGETSYGYASNGSSTLTAVRSLTTSHTYADSAPASPTVAASGSALTPRIEITISTP